MTPSSFPAVSFHSIRIYRLSQRTQKDPADNGFLHYPLPKDTCSGDEVVHERVIKDSI